MIIILWYMEAAHIRIYGTIGETSEGKGLSLLDVIMQTDRNALKYIVHFNSPGGNVDEAESIQNYLTKLQEQAEVIALGEGLVASAASKIFLSIDKRAATPDFQLMIHNPWGGVDGDAAYIEMYAEEMRRLEKDYESYYAERLGIDQEVVSTLMDKETYLSLEQCENLKIINYQLTPTPAIYAIAKTTQNEEPMKPEDKNWFEQKLNAIAQMLKRSATALTLMTKEGIELVFPGEAPAVGDSVDAPDGTYNVDYADKAWLVVITSGVVESLEEVEPEAPAENEELEALKKENAELKEQLNANATVVEGMKKQFEEVTARLRSIKSQGNPADQSKEKFDQKQEDPIKAYKEEKIKKALERKQRHNQKR